MKALKKFDFKPQTESAYDWDKMFDGGIYVATKGEDFECELNTFKTMLRDRAKKRYKTVKVHTDENSVTFQAIDMTPEQREHEDVRRSEREAAKAAAKDAKKNAGEATLETVEEEAA